uniref:Uncharacterized protein n=2 Tax=Zea mays TaxID=4577 RepID=C0PK17_MAIZE|nr:unknown [Zea mays]
MQGSTKAGSVEGWILFVGLDPWRECTALVAQLEVHVHHRARRFRFRDLTTAFTAGARACLPTRGPTISSMRTRCSPCTGTGRRSSWLSRRIGLPMRP